MKCHLKCVAGTRECVNITFYIFLYKIYGELVCVNSKAKNALNMAIKVLEEFILSQLEFYVKQKKT